MHNLQQKQYPFQTLDSRLEIRDDVFMLLSHLEISGNALIVSILTERFSFMYLSGNVLIVSILTERFSFMCLDMLKVKVLHVVFQ